MDFEKALRNEITRLQERLAGLLELDGGKSSTRKRKRAARKAKPVRRRVSAKTRAIRVQQGKYMSAVRGLPAAKRKAVAKLRSQKGVLAAIREAKRLLKAPTRKRRSARKNTPKQAGAGAAG